MTRVISRTWTGVAMVGEAAPAAAPAPEVAFDPKILVAIGLVGGALWQMSKERVFPPALTLLWYASHLLGLWPYGEPGEGE